ncbi:hypothetical protein [Reyranella sp.]|uniref:hypothetical protein n=1 Tax=Reyranella sp. TaxID=1929291 RepID=UPI00121EC0CD|nr:hypothetical protein [Reyranella sp.]TAJ88363.1 MAG: hypothetical protein EPO50_09770 [Reyranella sp.]
MNDRVCLSPFCGARTTQRVQRCPACGRRMFGRDEIAARGRHLVLLGLILAGVVGSVVWFWSSGLLPAVAGEPAPSFRGTAFEARALLFALIALILTGVCFTASGALMMAGRSSRTPTRAAIILFAAALVAILICLASAYLLRDGLN